VGKLRLEVISPRIDDRTLEPLRDATAYVQDMREPSLAMTNAKVRVMATLMVALSEGIVWHTQRSGVRSNTRRRRVCSCLR
jgi:hypothetical protein